MFTEDFFYKVRNRLLGTAHTRAVTDLFLVEVARAFSSILQARVGRSPLSTAYTDPKLYPYCEILSDMGFVFDNSVPVFFGGDRKDFCHPYNPIEDLEKYDFDVVLGTRGIDLRFFSRVITRSLKKIRSTSLKSCLNIRKLLLLAAVVCLLPSHTSLIEVGAYQCGTTIFLAYLCKELGKEIHLYACDTFQGMPAATFQDKQSSFFYDTGMFIDNPLQKVQNRVRKHNVHNQICLVPGDVENTLSTLRIPSGSLLFLDTDQYKGTKAGLDFLQRQTTLIPNILIDDISLPGVNLAIEEFLAQQPLYTRHHLTTNLDYLVLTSDENLQNADTPQ